MSKIAFTVAPQVSKGDITDNHLIENPLDALLKAREILNRTYKPAVITEITFDGDKMLSTRKVEFEVTVIEVSE